MGDKQLREFFVQRCELGLSTGLSFGREGSGFMRLNFAISREALERALQKIQRGLDGL
jgi:cystathionine beta-lyase